ncbi:hypothetical protein CDV36_007437 [Fusarium kuroshium]|uniref:Uncharacterized protein n=2 Tax=Fusarium solani species complex TaxID=232080 RepID=A0A3M2S5S4_9HYPO|nr:hypothetical protein CDV36_007437 [Fusarium kuroshium]RSM08001.1 hypothetical protein CEP52_004992 [Fusarium oligoseptatum]
MSSPREHWGLSCPNGGKFYICEEDDTQFVGCCVSDPCGTNKGKCPDGDLRATSFDKDLYAELPAQDCDSSQGTDNWYTCAFTDPPFLGCCSQNACGSGCPRNRLVGAKLSDIENNRLDFLEPRANTTETTASTGTATSTSSSTSEPTNDSDDSGLSTGATAGIAVGAAVVGVLAIILLAWIFWWKPRQKKKNGQEFQSVPAHPPMAGQPGTPGTFNPQPTFPVQSPMSTYQPSFSAASPNPAPHYPSGVSSMDQFKYSPQAAQFEHHQQPYGHYPDGTVPATSPGLPAYGQQYPPQMAPVMEMDATPTVAHEMGTGQEHQVTSHSPAPENKHGEGLGISK